MTDLIQIRKFSHSRASDDIECERAGYLSREWGGTGLTPVDDGWDLVYGDIIHRYLHTLSINGTIDYTAAREETLAKALDAFKNNQFVARDWAALAEGHLRGFVKSVWPGLMAEYTLFSAEAWIEWQIKQGYLFRARRDLLLKSKFDGHLAYVEFKTTSSDRPQWIASWDKAPQLHTGMHVERMVNHLEIDRAYVIGFYKGYKDDDGAPKSVFSRGHVTREYSFTPQYSYEYKRSKGWEPFSTFDEFPSLEAWVQAMPNEILSKQFPRTAPIFYREDIAAAWFRQQLIREESKAEGIQKLHAATTHEEIEAILDRYFRQNFSKCKPPFGYECKFQHICWIPWIGADPLGSGQFVRYDPNEDRTL